MLSKSAFNAFLKGLEEPPKHVIYILATTELGKLPDTIVSRCETHTFKTPNVDVLAQIVQSVAKAEEYTVPPEVAKIIALSGDGSFRDTLGSLQKVLDGVKDKKVTEGDVERILGIPKLQAIDDLITRAIEGSGVENILDTLRKTHTDGKVVYDLYLEKLREKLRNSKIEIRERERVMALLTKGLEEYRHLRFVDPMMMLEVVTQ